jgi:hypothetical protein
VQAGGQEPESDYPYTGVNGKCKFVAKDVDAKISTYTSVRFFIISISFLFYPFIFIVFLIRSPKTNLLCLPTLLPLAPCPFAWMLLTGKTTKGKLTKKKKKKKKKHAELINLAVF